MSYEEHCNDYALYGDPERDHWDYEFNAQFDRYDGWGDIDPAQEAAYDDAIGCAADYRYDDCPHCQAQDDLDDYEEIDENGVGYDDYPDEEVPF